MKKRLLGEISKSATSKARNSTILSSFKERCDAQNGSFMPSGKCLSSKWMNQQRPTKRGARANRATVDTQRAAVSSNNVMCGAVQSGMQLMGLGSIPVAGHGRNGPASSAPRQIHTIDADFPSENYKKKIKLRV